MRIERDLFIQALTVFLICSLVTAESSQSGMKQANYEDGSTSYRDPQANCQLTRFNGNAAHTLTDIYGYDEIVQFFDPANCGPGVTCPFEIQSVEFTLQDVPGAIWPCTVDVVIHRVYPCPVGNGDTCWAPNNFPPMDLYRERVVCDQATFLYPAIGTVTLTESCCVSGPFFLGLRYLEDNPGLCPSLVFDDNPTPDSCSMWHLNYQSAGGVVEWYVHFQGETVPGYPMWWINGNTASAECPQCAWRFWNAHSMHFPQLPPGDLINATHPLLLADDWECTKTGRIRNIHWWGYQNVSTVEEFQLTIRANVPAGTVCIDTTFGIGDCDGDGLPLTTADMVYLDAYVNSGGPAPDPISGADMNGDCVIDQIDLDLYQAYIDSGLSVFDVFGGYPVATCCVAADYSMPGELLWETVVTDFDVESELSMGFWSDWYDPSTGEVYNVGINRADRYDACLDSTQWFCQDSGEVYWLTVSAVDTGTGSQPWAWFASGDYWGGNAVWDTAGGTSFRELHEPDAGVSLIGDLGAISFDSSGNGQPLWSGSNYGEGWYYYPDSDTWRAWRYVGPFDTSRFLKAVFVLTAGGSWLEVALGWSTDAWSSEGHDFPPLPDYPESLYVNQLALYSGATDYTGLVLCDTVRSYNPEWVSIDLRGFNSDIGWSSQGTLTCRPKQFTLPLHLAFVIEGRSPCCMSPIRGNVDYDAGDAIDISDLVYLVDYMFTGGPPPLCFEEADMAASCGTLDISDLVYLIDYMFVGGPTPPTCP